MLQPGDQIDIWVIEKALGSGGMGSVYRCHNRNASRILAAVKVLDSTLRKYPEAEARFIREAEILFQLDHPNIVKVRNVRTDADPPYLEMEFVEGESLEERLRRGALPFEQAVEFLTQICAAVAYLHKKGVRHRDIKPANLLITKEGRVKLVDFGLAMEADATRITQSGMTFGTVSYAPPEWIAPDTLDPAKWDLYAVGVMTYEMLTGQLAFPVSGQGSARQQAMQVIVGKQGHPPLDPGEQFHDDVRALVRDLTHSDPNKRIGSAAEAVRRSRALVKTLRREAGVTLAPLPAEVLEDGLDITPDPPPERAGLDTWMGTDVGAPARNDASPPARPTAEPSAPSARHSGAISIAPRATLGVGILLALGVVVLLGAAGAVALALVVMGGSTRDLDVAITGLPADTPVSIRVDGQPPDHVDKLVFSFDDLSVGAHRVTWAIGERCPADRCPGDACPAWCGTGSRTVEVASGQGRQVAPLELAPPSPRRVRVRLPRLQGAWDLDFDLGTIDGRVVEGAVLFDDVLPGSHTLTARVGTCAATGLGCWPDGECPPGCTSYRGKLVVPWGEGEFGWDLEIPDPAPVPDKPAPRPAPAPSPAAPTPAPPAPAAGASEPVTVGAFAGWLAKHPEWQADQAIADGRAKAGYLRGWDGATPPPGVSAHHAVTDITWYAASAYCKSRGGLAPIDAPPTRWTESPTHPYLDLRTDGGKAMWRASDGRTSSKIAPADPNTLAGFRCAR